MVSIGLPALAHVYALHAHAGQGRWAVKGAAYIDHFFVAALGCLFKLCQGGLRLCVCAVCDWIRHLGSGLCASLASHIHIFRSSHPKRA